MKVYYEVVHDLKDFKGGYHDDPYE